MSYHLACYLGHEIAAIASVTGSMSDYTYNGCSPDHPTAVMQIHGANDAVIPFDGAYGFRSIPESIEVDMEEIKSKEKVRLSSLSENSDYDFPSTLKNQDPVLVSVLTARGGGLDFEDEEVDDVEEGAEAESTEASDEKSSEETNSDNSEEKSE